MLKRKLCEAVFTWELQCPGPLLIADGRYNQLKEQRQEEWKDKHYPDKIFINRDDLQSRVVSSGLLDEIKLSSLSFYIPGTSLRGPFRSQAERIVRSLLPEQAQAGNTACDPFEQNHSLTLSCSKRLENEPDSKYRFACPICKLFGCAGLASRITFSDAEFSQRTPIFRDMIGIDRFTGGVYKGDKGGANMRFQVLENSTFKTTVTVTNFELWQLGLLAYVFQDFADSLVAIGFGKTKGFGQVKGKVTDIVLAYPVSKANGALQHLGTLVTIQEEIKQYGLDTAQAPVCNLDRLNATNLELYERFKVRNTKEFFTNVARAFNTFIQARCQEAPV